MQTHPLGTMQRGVAAMRAVQAATMQVGAAVQAASAAAARRPPWRWLGYPFSEREASLQVLDKARVPARLWLILVTASGGGHRARCPATPPAWRMLPGPTRRLPVQAQARISLKITERLGLYRHWAPSPGVGCKGERGTNGAGGRWHWDF